MARACRFTAPYGSRGIHHDGKPFIEIHRALNKHGTGSSRPVDVDDVSREILSLLCGTRKSKSSLAGLGAMPSWWPFKSKKKQLDRDPRRMAQAIMFIPGAKGMSSRGELVTMRGARRKRRRR